MIHITSNIIFLRKKNGYTRQQVADAIGIKRSLYGAYEEGRCKPSLEILPKLSELYLVPVQDLIYSDLQHKRIPKEQPSTVLYKKYITSPPKIKAAVNTLLEIE